MQRLVHAIALTYVLGTASTVAADDLQLTFRDGRVTVVASDVTVAAIMQEWSRVGGTQVVDAAALGRQTVQLELIDVPEPEALRVLLRDAAGYLAAPRHEGTTQGSRFDRVVIMAATRRAPTISPTIRPNPAAPPPVQRTPGASIPGRPGTAPGTFNGVDSPDELNDLNEEELDELREVLPQPFNLIDRARGATATSPGESGAATASRPGVVITPTDDQAPVFIRRPVRPQPADDARR